MPARAISILGCGWVGLPLAKHLLALGYPVLGSTTSAEKIPVIQNCGIRPFLLEAAPQLKGENIPAFFNSSLLFLNIPFERYLEDPSSVFAGDPGLQSGEEGKKGSPATPDSAEEASETDEPGEAKDESTLAQTGHFIKSRFFPSLNTSSGERSNSSFLPGRPRCTRKQSRRRRKTRRFVLLRATAARGCFGRLSIFC